MNFDVEIVHKPFGQKGHRDCQKKSEDNENCGAVALELPDGRIVTGKNTKRMSASAACVFNAVKMLAGIKDSQKLISPYVIGPIIDLKTKILKEHHKTLTLEEALLALSICAASDAQAANAMEQLSALEGCDAHSTHMLLKRTKTRSKTRSET